MKKSNFIQLNLSGERTDEAFSIPLDNNSKNVAESDQKAGQVDDHSKYLDLDGQKNFNLQLLENERSNESGYEEYSSSNPVCFAIRTVGSEVDEMTSNTSKTNNNCSTPDNKVMLNNNSENESEEDNQQVNKTKRRRSYVIGLKRKPKRDERSMEDGELDDSGIILDNSNEIGSAEKSDSLNINKLFATSESDLPKNESESDEGEVSDTGSKDETEITDVQQVNKVERQYKVFTLKRKLISQGIENEESDNLREKLNKRGHGRYMLRDIPSNSFSGYPNKQKPAKKHRSNKLRKRNTSQDDNDDKTEDSVADMVATPTDSAKSDEPQDMDDSLPDPQVQHNNMILKLLNEGSPESIKNLSRVGPKTANMIHQYRKLNGKLKSIRDLQNMPGWSMRFFELFLSANNIVLD